MTRPQQSLNTFVEWYEHLYSTPDGDLLPTEYRLIKAGHKAKSFVSDPDTLEQDFAQLCQWNNKGFNIYSVVNRPDPAVLSHLAGDSNHPQNPHSTADSHITAINALFVDLDTAPADNEPSNLEKLLDAPLMPSMIVQSSLPHKLQGYWLLEPDAVSVSEFKTLQRQLAKRFNGDKAVVNAARIMRVAGFNHVKDPRNPMPSRLLESDGTRYDRETILSQLELDPTPPAPRVTVPLDLTNASKDWQRVVTALQQWQPVSGERRRATLLVMAVACELGVSQQQAIRDVSSVKQAWGSDDYLESSEACARWAFEQRPNDDRAGVGQLVTTLERELGFEIGKLDVNKWGRQVAAINAKAQVSDASFDVVIDVNVPFLSDAWGDIRQRIDAVKQKSPHGAFVMIQSPIGSGKSTALFNDTEIVNSDSACFVAPLVTLCSSIAKDTNSTNYQSMSPQHYYDYHKQPRRRLTTTPNSLPKMRHTRAADDPNGVYTHKLLVLDESDAVVSRLSDVDVRNEQSMYHSLRTAISGALSQNGIVFFASAYHQQAELTLVDSVLTDKQLETPKILIRNHYQAAQGRTYELLNVSAADGVGVHEARQKALTDKVLKRLAAGASVAVGSDSEDYLKMLYEDVVTAYPDKAHLLLTALTKNEDDQRPFLDDENRDARPYDFVGYSPVLGTGFDIAKDLHNHEVFLYFCARSVTPKTAVQMTGRFRDAKHIVIVAEDYHDSSPQHPEAIRTELLASLKADNELIKTDLDGRRVWVDEGFANVHIHNVSHDRWQRASWRTHFLAMLEGWGFTRRDSDAIQVTVDDAKQLRDVKTRVREFEATEIANSAQLTPTEADSLRKNPDITRNQQQSLRRFEYESYFGVTATPERIYEDKDQRGHVVYLALARADDDTLRYHRDSELTRAVYSDGLSKAMHQHKVTRYALKRELLRRALDAAGIDRVTLTQGRDGYHRDSDSVTAFVKWLEQHRVELGNVCSLPPTEQLSKSPLQFLGVTLRQMGFVTDSDRVECDDGIRRRVYHAALDFENHPNLRTRLSEREAVVEARVTTWLEHRSDTVHTKTFYYRNEQGVDATFSTSQTQKQGVDTQKTGCGHSSPTAAQNQPQKWQQTLEKLLEMIDAGAVVVSESTDKHLREARAAALQGDGAMLAALKDYCERPDVLTLVQTEIARLQDRQLEQTR